MKNSLAMWACALGLVLAAQWGGAGWAVGADVAYLPGITSNDSNPEGCVSCHKGSDTLKSMLDTLKHRKLDDTVVMIPEDCKSCHSEEEGLESMAAIAHSMHYASGSKSDFVVKHQGSCLNCHALATGSGEVSVKSGKKNW